MEKKVHIVNNTEEGMRLDRFLSAREPCLSRSYLQKLCAEGNVLVNGKQQLKSGYRVRENQKVEVCIPPPEIIAAQPEDLPLEIIYEDNDLLVVNKPKGMVVHPAPGHHRGTLVNALLSHCDVLFALGDRIRPGIVHRLDKDTSGLLVVAKNEPSFRVLSAQIKAREMKREYYAIVHRLPPVDEGTIDLPLGRDPNNRKKIAVRKNGTGRRAVTHFKVLDKKGPFYLLSLRLETGRTHQIRVHLSYIGSPVVGDPLYGPKRSPYNKYGQFLHARTLGFKHPRNKEYMEFTAEPGKEFSDLLKYGGKR
ncbi:MAG: RluA family pseudouridine synthase [Firmicutes bacterium]|jgi:23S rRNA pseudouridine1911/1915/1917 synthase|nr:RluA family pseudouridine synthase [Bacillota bacterium]